MAKYGLLGFPLTHSFSKRFFTEKFAEENLEHSYENFEIDTIKKFPEIIKNNSEIVGLNVTIPYKEQVIPYLDELDEASQKIAAVNTIRVIRENGKVFLKGYNTDTFGFEKSISQFLKPFHTKALILGTGGASKALKYVLVKLGIDYISASIEELKENEITYAEIDKKVMNERLIIINATPLGTYPKEDTFPSIPYEHLNHKHLLFDLVYNPEVSIFLGHGNKVGATTKNGYDMLLNQALKSWEIWNSEG